MRLGEGEFGDVRQLQPAAMDRAALVCARFADLARSHGADRFVTVATSATREARNAGEFVRLLRDEAGLDVHVVSGREEARLDLPRRAQPRPRRRTRALSIDIGGGSTEVAVGGASGADVVESISARRHPPDRGGSAAPTRTAGTRPRPTRPSGTACV